MDNNPITQTWVCNMFQRFEAVFHEVDEFVSHDTVKYVENHMQSVGQSVKNFYNGVVQDIILPPLSETYRSSTVAVQENTIDNSTNESEEINESPVEEDKGDTNPNPNPNPNPNFEHEGDETVNEEEKVLYDTISERSDSVIEDVIDLNVGIEEKSERVSMETNIIDEFEINLNTLKLQDSTEVKSLTSGNENKDEKLSHILLSAKSNDSLSTGGYFSTSSQDLSSCESLNHNNNSDFALVDESKHELDGSMVDFEDLDLDTFSLTDKEELVESCVVVEGKNVFSFPYRAKRNKSYKKIIRDAFMSKKKLTEEYKLLAIYCGDVDEESSQQKEKNATKSQVEVFPDSEWELL